MKISIVSRLRRRLSFANIIIAIGVVIAIVYLFSYLFPLTDNAFVVNNTREVAAQVTGYITNIYVKNGDLVKRGDKLFSVFATPYQLDVQELTANKDAIAHQILILKRTREHDMALLASQQAVYHKLKQDDDKYQLAYKIKAISLMALQNSEQDTQSAYQNVIAARKQLDVDQEAIKAKEDLLRSADARLKLAEVRLGQTIVYAQSTGILQNMYLAIGQPVNANTPLFSFLDTDNIFIQANFNETDLRYVHKGSKAIIMPRLYLGEKVFHGVVTADYWAANRQVTASNNKLQEVTNENQWILLPQRLPVQIRVLDADPQYPLRAGTSAYVYIPAH